MKKILISLLTAAAFGAGAYQISNDFSFSARRWLPFPVASVRPTMPGQVAAIDVMPSAGAQPHPDNGYAWFDACNADILYANGGVPVTCARLGIRENYVEVGSRNFDGGNPLPVCIVQGRAVLACFQSGHITLNGDLVVNGTVKANGYYK